MDYVRWKKRIIVNTQYLLLFFSSNIDINQEISIQMFARNGIYIVSVFGGENNIQALIREIESMSLKSNIYYDIDLNCLLETVNSTHLETFLIDILSLQSNSDLLISKPIQQNEYNFDFKMESTVFVPPPILPMELGFNFDFDFLINTRYGLSKILGTNLDINSLLGINMNTPDLLSYGASIEIDEINLIIDIINNEPVIIQQGLDNVFYGEMLLSSKISRIIKLIKNYTFDLVNNLNLLTGALLQDYDNIYLSEMDASTLKELFYKDYH